MWKRITWVIAGCVIAGLLVLAGDLLYIGWSGFSSQAAAGGQPSLFKSNLPASSTNENRASTTLSGRLPSTHAAAAASVPVVARATAPGAVTRAAVQAVTGSDPAPSTLNMRVLGRDGRVMDRLAVLPGDILRRDGDTLQDESASTVTISAPLAQVEAAQHLALLYVSSHLFGNTASATHHAQRRSDVLIVLLLPSTRLSLPPGQTFGDLESEQVVQVSGTLNIRTHLLLRPTSFVVGVAQGTQQCSTLSVIGDQDCAEEPANTP